MKRKRSHTVWLLCLLLAVSGCGRRKSGIPRPEGFFRIERSDTSYRIAEPAFPLSFEVPASSRDVQPNGNPSWINIVYPAYQATIWCSYLPLTPQNKERLFRESRDLVYRHAAKTSAITAQGYADESVGKYAVLYTLAGDAATPLQFVATDSATYLFRGALYFDTPVRADSVAPVVGYIADDMRHIIETLHTRR